MATIADLERQFYIATLTAPVADETTSNADLERRYYIQVLGLSEPVLRSTADLKQDKLD